MTEPILDSAGIMAGVRQGEAAGVPSMCGWILRPMPASLPSRSIMDWKPRLANGAPRSDVNTNAHGGGFH
jgi:hypothetical protein